MSETEKSPGNGEAAPHRSGYIALVGPPNVGKSTLMNRLLQERLAIVTDKPQTTRRNTLGILNGPGFQAVLLDTPGVMVPRYALHRAMVEGARSALLDADVVLFLADPDTPVETPMPLAERSKEMVLALNKIDACKHKEELLPLLQQWYDTGQFREIIPISALDGTGIDDLVRILIPLLPEGPAFYPEDQITDQPERFFVTEIIRERLFELFAKEVPYASEVSVQKFNERPGGKDFIEAWIYVEQESQKAILIGKGGAAIRTLGSEAREHIEEFLGRPVYLELRVRVLPKWRRRADALRKLGVLEGEVMDPFPIDPSAGLTALARHARATLDSDIRASYAADASGLRRIPDAVLRPESEEEVSELLRLCSAHGVAVTPQGLRSSTTGASVPESGAALLERMNRILLCDPERRLAVVEPGVVTAEFKRQVRAQGLFYPVDPTSEEECTIGGTVACNASGSRTYRYGPTRSYVRGLRVVLADGSVLDLKGVESNKNSAGYFGFQNPLDVWIGSEGTLGVVTQITLQLLLPPPGFFGALAFFPDWETALSFVLSADQARRAGSLQPRCLELFDRASLDLIAPEMKGMRIPATAGAAIFFEEEVRPENAVETMERWYALIEEAGGPAEETRIAQTESEQADLRRLRHALPAGMNERGSRAARSGGRKVSTDFAVPLARLPVMMNDAYRIVGEVFGGFHVAYGHVGNGHPHFNLLAENPQELALADQAVRLMARRAMELGGTLCAEHGIGKLKLPLYRELYPDWIHASMQAIKDSLDPKGILSPGNLFARL